MLNSINILQPFEKLVADVSAGIPLPGLGLPRAARLPVLVGLHQKLNVPILFITHRTDRALKIFDELTYWSKDIYRLNFPEPNPLFYEQAAWGGVAKKDRLETLAVLCQYLRIGSEKPEVPPVIVAPIRALMTRTIPRREFLKAIKSIRRGKIIAPDTLKRHLVEIGYQSTSIVLEAGQFSSRGGILDIWPQAEEFPKRLEFFGDEVDTIKVFEPASQRTIESIETITITPAMEVISNRDLPEFEGKEITEFHLPLIYQTPASIIDYMPKGALIVIDDMDGLEFTATDIEEQALKTRKDSVNEGLLPDDFPTPYISWSEIRDSLGTHQWLELGRGTTEDDSNLSRIFTVGPRFGGQLKSVMDYLAEEIFFGSQISVVSRQVKRLENLWEDKAKTLELENSPEYVQGTLGEGWILNHSDGKKRILLTDSEIFGWEKPRPKRKYKRSIESPEQIYEDLDSGDWVVHIDYGIGQYQGLVRKRIEGIDREFLLIAYDEGSELFVPVHQADRLSKYIGPTGSSPRPSRLGSSEWTNTKKRVRESVQEIAQDLLDLYARRRVAEGFTFESDNAWQMELETSFPYIETDDQLKAIRDVKKDMESDQPMDRLLCGDVGYGKTEVALRAAFKSVMSGKQVALLVPTTILAQQHFETFRKRLIPYPVEVEMLSRFRSPKQQDEIIKRLGNGSVDIVIGTHRLVSNDVDFKDLGLLVIDEEQRFGVAHKEHFKKMRTEIDVLTMTATPIPRTLYMALSGVRDISSINTPPDERLPVITHIGSYNPRLVRQAIIRELERGGQVFFVHNRVRTIRAMERHIQRLV
ncbi:MAG: DEAD/DEAH box helicase, partial [Anaerolineaceae bacterium]|nr:DEAD/DEAH box helicase [Anaerolineaceae bacterium]